MSTSLTTVGNESHYHQTQDLLHTPFPPSCYDILGTWCTCFALQGQHETLNRPLPRSCGNSTLNDLTHDPNASPCRGTSFSCDYQAATSQNRTGGRCDAPERLSLASDRLMLCIWVFEDDLHNFPPPNISMEPYLGQKGLFV